jgi:glycolate oxidase
MFTPADLETMQWLKRAFDPTGIANPTKIFPTPKTCGEASRAWAARDLPDVDRF